MYDIAILLNNESQLCSQNGNLSIGLVTKKDMEWTVLFNHVLSKKIAKIVYCLADFSIVHNNCIEKIINVYKRFGNAVGAVYSDDDNQYNSYCGQYIYSPIAINGNISGNLFDEKNYNKYSYTRVLNKLATKSIIYHIPERLVRK